MSYHNLAHKKNAKYLSLLGKLFDGLFDDEDKMAKAWVNWWGDIDEAYDPAYLVEKLADVSAKLMAALLEKKEINDFQEIWSNIGDLAYYGRDKNKPKNCFKNKAAQSGAADIRALIKADFIKGIYYNVITPKILTVITADRFIDNQHGKAAMGQYRIKINLGGIPMQTTKITIYPHQCRSTRDDIHPHVRNYDGMNCLGQVGAVCGKHFRGGFLFEAVSMLAILLNTHNYGGYGGRDAVLQWRTAKEGGDARNICAFCMTRLTKYRPYISCRHCGARHCRICRSRTPATAGKGYLCRFCEGKLPMQAGKQKTFTFGVENK